MLAALEKHFSRRALVAAARAATSSGSSCPRARTPSEVLDRAEGVTAVLGTDFGGGDNTIRLAYSYVSPEEIDEGVERLAAAVGLTRSRDGALGVGAGRCSGRGTSCGCGGGSRIRPAARKVGQGRSSASAQSPWRWK